MIVDVVVNGGDIGKSLCDGVVKCVVLVNNVKMIVVIYVENCGFDNLYGLFLGVNGIFGVNFILIGIVVV